MKMAPSYYHTTSSIKPAPEHVSTLYTDYPRIIRSRLFFFFLNSTFLKFDFTIKIIIVEYVCCSRKVAAPGLSWQTSKPLIHSDVSGIFNLFGVTDIPIQRKLNE